MLPVELEESGADSSVLLMSALLLLELSLSESIELSALELLSAGMLDEEDDDAAASSGWLLVLLCDSSVRALREVVLVLVRVSVRAAPERSLVTAPMSELELLVPDAADGVMSDGEAAPAELELVLGTVALLLLDDSDGAAVDEDGDVVVELELS